MAMLGFVFKIVLITNGNMENFALHIAQMVNMEIMIRDFVLCPLVVLLIIMLKIIQELVFLNAMEHMQILTLKFVWISAQPHISLIQ